MTELQTPTPSINQRSNWLRAAVLGSNDGIVSVAGLVVGVAGATDNKLIILVTGVAGILAGALSMAAGEYISVSTQRDMEQMLVDKEHAEHGSTKTGEAFRRHVMAEHGVDPDGMTNPWHAAIASAASFFVGSLIPMVAVMLPLGVWTVPVTFFAVILALIFTGWSSARLGGTNKRRSIIRVVIGGVLAMVVTYGIGRLFGVAGI
ncbi:MAG TPA: VIT family protein [Dongiaceae bacterium]|nr:VIT family protein [Dongiaceae bacterium]